MSDEEEIQDWSYTSHIGKDLRGIRGRYAIWRKANWWDAQMDDDLRSVLTKKWPKE